MEDVLRLIAKAEIEDCLKRYARGIDRRDWTLARGCFHDDATDHHGAFHGNGDEFIAWVSARHADLPFAMHYLLNCLVEFRTDSLAAVETYFWAIQRSETISADGKKAQDHEVFGRYIDRFENRGDGWKIAQRKVVYDSTRTQPSTQHLRKIVGLLGRRDAQDPVYALLQAAE
ncbi:nuclear transport factor 2 family protein [Antarctobacter sp.]|uniref:nuclear transport factor 2 family protein n=1 Tax=Antarctobacter sp. TaxID=1872577 RepID=UPI003A910E73